MMVGLSRSGTKHAVRAEDSRPSGWGLARCSSRILVDIQYDTGPNGFGATRPSVATRENVACTRCLKAMNGEST